METYDWKKAFKELYSPPRKPVLVSVPPINFLMVDGIGDPNTATAYHEALDALYSTAYTLKFALKKAGGPEFSVMPLEGLWWAEDMNAFLDANRAAWQWTMLIGQPNFVTQEQVSAAMEEAGRKKDLPALSRLRFEPFDEGQCAQVMHVGSYAAEGPTIAALHDFIATQGYERRGKHHEIYLGDPRRSAPEKLKTVIRQPIARG
jgi:hypothetical protein